MSSYLAIKPVWASLRVPLILVPAFFPNASAAVFIDVVTFAAHHSLH